MPAPARPKSDFSDIVHTHAFGAARFALPLVLYAVTYPLFIARYGMETFALWSLIFSVAYAISIANFGFGDFFTREISKTPDRQALAAVKRRIVVARLLSLAAGGAIIAALGAVEAVAGILADSPYDRRALLLTGLLVGAGAIQSIQNRLSEAVLRAHHANAVVEFMQSIKQLIPIAGLLAGVFAGHPLELFAAAFLVAELAQALMLRRYVTRNLPGWHALTPEPPSLRFRMEATALLGSSLPLYGLSLAMICRDPVLRLILAAQYGMTLAASYEIAFRIGISCFNAASIGAASFLPSLSRDLGEGRGERAAAKLLVLTALMSGLAAAIFGIVLALCGTIVPLWIEGADDRTLALCRIMLLWLWFNALMVPAWYYLIAAGREKYLALAVALHSLFSFAAFVLGLGSETFLTLWAGAGLLIYLMAAGAATRRAGRQLVPPPRPGRWLAPLALVPVAAGLALALGQEMPLFESPSADAAVAAGFLALALILTVISLGRLRSLAQGGAELASRGHDDD